jgi:hypothetical protein
MNGDEKVHEHDIVKRDRTEGFDLTDPDVPEGTREKAESSESNLCEKYLTLPLPFLSQDDRGTCAGWSPFDDRYTPKWGRF